MNIKALLKEKKMTQTQLAKVLGVSDRTIRRWIRGDRMLSQMSILAIYQAIK